MNFISDALSTLPIQVVLPVALVLVFQPVVRLLLEAKNQNRTYNKELLDQIVEHFEKYSRDNNKVSAFFIREAARSRYRADLSLTEIQFFLENIEADYSLIDFANHKPHVTLIDGRISLVKPDTPLLNGKLNISLREIWGYCKYVLVATVGGLLTTLSYPNAVWGVVKWLSVLLLIGYAFGVLWTTFAKHDARKYVESLKEQ